MKRLAAALAATALCHPVNAAEPASCIRVENDLDRLACYDKAHGRTSKFEPLKVDATLKTPGEWVATVETSKLTDKTNVFMSVRSKETIRCGFGFNDKISLIIRCQDEKTSLYISTGCHLVSSEYNDYGDVTYRLDKDAAQKRGFSESTNHSALGLWSGGDAIPFIKGMFGKSSLLVKMTPYSESPFTATFDITGLSEVIKPLREACKW